MKTQTVTFTPSSTMNQEEALGHIRALLPDDVNFFLRFSMINGDWSREISETNGTYTIVNTFTDEAATEYRDLMAGVSEAVKSQLATDGWSITFTPETADL